MLTLNTNMKPKLKCPKCQGVGTIPNPQFVGEQLRKEREAAGVSMREVARRMKMSAPFLSDVENGFRHFSPEHTARYRAALKAR